MDIHVSFPGGKRVDALVDGHVIRTDQPLSAGGEGSAPAPFDLFLASLGTCAGIYVLGFCQARGLPTSDISLIEHVTKDPVTGLPSHVDIELVLPPAIPERYHAALIRVAEQCKVKKVLAAPPVVAVTVAAPTSGAQAIGRHA